MSPDRLKISKEFHINGQGEWLSLEYPLSPEDNPIECFNKARELLMQASQKTDWYQGFQPEKATASDILDPHEALRLQKLINEATTEEELEKYYPDAEKFGLTGAWDKKLKELKNQQ